MIGVNTGAGEHASAQIDGKTKNPYSKPQKQDKSLALGIFVLAYLLACTGAVIYYYVERKKIDRYSHRLNPQLGKENAPPVLSEIKTETAQQQAKKKKGYAIQDESLDESLNSTDRLQSETD